MKTHELKIKLLGFCLIILLMGGCGSSESGSVSEMYYLDGYVAAKTDISAAGLQVKDTGGLLIAEKNAPATSDSGAFMISVSYLPYKFRVISIGGMEWGENVNYTLMGQFEAFNPDSDTIYLNFVTTLVCVYLDHNSDKSLSEATNAVKVFLDIPAEVNIGAGLYHNDKYFNPLKFMREAATEGGVAAFMETLVDEIIQGSVETHAFPPPELLKNPAPATCAGVSMAAAARNGVIAWGAGFALNKGMEALFPGTGAPTKNDIAELKGMLINIQTQLTQLGNQLASAKNEIKAEIKKSEYNIGTMQLADYVTLIDNTFTNLKKEIDQNPAILTAGEVIQRTNTINALLITIGDKISPYLGSLHKKVYGDGTLDADGLYKIYADMIKAQKRFLTKANYQDKVKNLFLYYNQIEATELYLAVEYYHATNQSKTIVDTATEKLGANSQAEQDWYDSVEHVQNRIVLDHEQDLMFAAGDWYDGKLLPWSGTQDEISDLLNQMRTDNWFNHTEWTWPQKFQVASLVKDCGNEQFGQCLQRQGWPIYHAGYYLIATDNGTVEDRTSRNIYGVEAHVWYEYELTYEWMMNAGPWHILPLRGSAYLCIW